MIEAMASGTPVIAFRRGSVPEVVKDGTSGFIVDTVEEAVKAVRRIASLDRAKVRAEFERHFTAERMARDYLDVYQELAFARARRHARRLKSRAATSQGGPSLPSSLNGHAAGSPHLEDRGLDIDIQLPNPARASMGETKTEAGEEDRRSGSAIAVGSSASRFMISKSTS